MNQIKTKQTPKISINAPENKLQPLRASVLTGAVVTGISVAVGVPVSRGIAIGAGSATAEFGRNFVSINR